MNKYPDEFSNAAGVLAQYREVLRQNPDLKKVRDYLEAVVSVGK